MAGKIKILLADDSLLQRRQMKQILGQLGYHDVFEAADGREVVDMYKKIKPSLVFLDIVMPLLDGLAALEQLIEYDSNAKVVMLTSTGTEANVRKAVQVGAKDFIQKPYGEEQIKQLIQRVLG